MLRPSINSSFLFNVLKIYKTAKKGFFTKLRSTFFSTWNIVKCKYSTLERALKPRGLEGRYQPSNSVAWTENRAYFEKDCPHWKKKCVNPYSHYSVACTRANWSSSTGGRKWNGFTSITWGTLHPSKLLNLSYTQKKKKKKKKTAKSPNLFLPRVS